MLKHFNTILISSLLIAGHCNAIVINTQIFQNKELNKHVYLLTNNEELKNHKLSIKQMDGIQKVRDSFEENNIRFPLIQDEYLTKLLKEPTELLNAFEEHVLVIANTDNSTLFYNMLNESDWKLAVQNYTKCFDELAESYLKTLD